MFRRGQAVFRRLSREAFRGLMLLPAFFRSALLPTAPAPCRLDVAGVSVTLQRKRMRHLRLRLDRAGRWQASAPLRAPLAEVEAFLLSRRAWMEEAERRWRASTGVCGSDESLAPVELRRRRAVLLARAAKRCPRWEAALGVQAARLRVRAMRSRWGSCNPRSRDITLSLALWDRADEALELILVHELIHLIEPGHGPRFKALMKRHLPDWKARWKRLSRGGDGGGPDTRPVPSGFDA